MYPNELIRKYIEDNHLKSSSIAHEMGIESPKLSQVINDKRKMTIEELVTFCAAVNATPNEILGIENK